jgi:UDP-galactopyranose mutase
LNYNNVVKHKVLHNKTKKNTRFNSSQVPSTNSNAFIFTPTNHNKLKKKKNLAKNIYITFLVGKLGITRAWDLREIVANCNSGNWELLELGI